MLSDLKLKFQFIWAILESISIFFFFLILISAELSMKKVL